VLPITTLMLLLRGYFVAWPSVNGCFFTGKQNIFLRIKNNFFAIRAEKICRYF